MDSGYEGKTANYGIYLLAILTVFKPKNYRLLYKLGEIPEKF